MASHRLPEPELSRSQPTAVAEGARLVLGALVAVGWVTLPDATINTVATAVAALASIALTWWTHGRVTPLAHPRDNTGAPLVPVRPPKHLAE